MVKSLRFLKHFRMSDFQVRNAQLVKSKKKYFKIDYSFHMVCSSCTPNLIFYLMLHLAHIQLLDA